MEYRGESSFREIVSNEIGDGKERICPVIERKIEDAKANILEFQSISQFVVFGVGEQCAIFFSKHPKNIKYVKFFCDRNSDLYGKKMFGQRIISPDELAQIDFGFIAVSSPKFFDDICHMLTNKYNIEPKRIVSLGDAIYSTFSLK